MDIPRTDGIAARVFVLDDSPVSLTFVRLLLEEHGYRVHTFDSPLGITKEVMRHRPDLVLVDINMPSITGDKVCRLIRSASATREVVVLLYSSLPQAELEQIARAAGADGVIVKTGDGRQLVQTVERYLARRHKSAQSGSMRAAKP